jgi:cytosine/adenosine deaminase-related metal-dependent hydrolase
MSIGIRGKWIFAYDGEEHRLLRDGVVVTEGNRIKHVGKSYGGPVDRWIEAPTHVVIPGMICTHTHSRASIQKNLSERTFSPKV